MSVSTLEISDIPPVSDPAAGINLVNIYNNRLIINKTIHDDLKVSTSISPIAINDLASVSGIPVICKLPN